MDMYLGIIVNNEAVKVDRVFTYKVPDKLCDKVKKGRMVTVPFGNGNKKIYGFIVDIFYDIDDNTKLKDILDIDDKVEFLTDENIKLIKIMREKYLCTYLECIKVMIPSGITKGATFKTKNVLIIGEPLSGKYDKENYKNVVETIKIHSGIYNKSELVNEFNISLSTINTLIKHGFLAVEKSIVNRYNEIRYKSYEEKVLNQFQQKCVDKILIHSMNNKFLIHGITGSGKTEIYMNLVKDMMKNNKGSIILIPEIALTPQMVERFKGRFGRDVAIFHSRLSSGERFDEWMRVKMGNVKVAIGARSAIFLPFENLGLIVIDEEHETSYKSDSDPKYNAREIACLKADIEGCKVVLGSATPSIETYYKAMQGEYDIITLDRRADGAKLPTIEVVDMREELKQGNKSMFSRRLHEEMCGTLAKKEQAIMFLNRRGFSTFVSCRECGYVFKCSNCDISLTYHKNNTLTCHYCGMQQEAVSTCPKCKSKYVKYFGVGTEQLEHSVRKTFSDSKPLRMDFDTTRGKYAYEQIYNDFAAKRYNVLIGTQMIAKGLDFKDVTLVGIIAADLSLNLPDYRAGEKTFQLVTQVAGRAGRGSKEGKVILQTYTPENYSIIYAAENNYVGFYEEEIAIRKLRDYPPFAKILCINVSSENEENLIKGIQTLADKLRTKIFGNDKVELLGPCPCGVSKIKNLCRWQIIIKGDFDDVFAMEVKNIIYDYLNYKNIRIGIDINPNSLL
ncbi:MAG: primosomal protein N' [Clostridium sp.]|uniref:primosomal protein N' n=1 Tax=Clostridium sp. TaxID=1506 RepID=UPI003069ABC1